MNIQSPTLLTVIKATALNKGRARTWIERPELVNYGFVRGARVTIELNSDNITIRLDPFGKRKVCGKLDKPLFDICEPTADRDARWNGADKVAVFIEQGLIVVRAAQ